MSNYILIHGIRIAKTFEPETFGRLTTIGPRFLLPVGTKWEYAPRQVCRCVCGNITIVQSASLITGNTESCGCKHKEKVYRHGGVSGRNRSEYASYVSMLSRCTNPNTKDYPNYGGRGIRVCDRWREPNGQGFLNFLSDMGAKPFKNLTVERKLVNGNYCPENCCWATNTEQARNRRSNLNLTHDGKTQCLTAWAEELGMTRSTLKSRLQRGWSIEEVLTAPVRKPKQSPKP